MAKIRTVVNGATLEVEGDEDACAEASRLFHLTIAEQSLRAVEARLAELKPLQKHRRDLLEQIDRLKLRSIR